MFQHTIQDVLSLTSADDSEAALLGSFAALVSAFEPFDSGELIVRSDGATRRHVFGPALPDVSQAVLDAIADEPTVRFDSAEDLRAAGIALEAPWNSVLVLRLATEPTTTAAILLAHRRAWSFAATPLSRVRTLGNVLHRLIARSRGGRAESGADAKTAEIAGLRARLASLEKEIADLRDRKKR